PAPGAQPGRARAALVVRDSFRHRRDIERAYRSFIDGAREEVFIANAYFLPRRGLRAALQRAARRGVRVVLLLQGRFDYLLLHLASRATYERLLAAGVEIWEYRRAFLHAKVAVFDRQVACVGSSNLDPYSLMMARESNVFVDDAGFAASLRASLDAEMGAGAERIVDAAWRQLPWWRRLRLRAAVVLMRLLLAFAGVERYR
ncbi:MAG: phospholipase D-like domain-containing protein, partial [Burkholderiales bacterium]